MGEHMKKRSKAKSNPLIKEPLYLGKMSEIEINEALRQGFDDIQNGRVISEKEVGESFANLMG